MRLCLNMIVKNESAILERCLRSVRPHIDCYFICDTGSTDDTVEIIKKTLENIPGEVVHTTFQNFEQARNEALHGAQGSSLSFDYLLLIDADMELVAEPPEWRESLSHPAYSMRQLAGSFSYHNVRLVSRNAKAKYVGLTHEYLDLDCKVEPHREVYMLDHACGSSRSEKTERDLALLKLSIENNPKDSRAHFYLAQTLRESTRYDEAIAAYEKRINLGGWEEEVWFSYFMIARCYEGKGDIPHFLAACHEAYNFRPTRAEPLYAMARHYRLAGQHDSCVMMCELGLEVPTPTDVLFIEEHIYTTGFRHEFSISGFYSKLPARRTLARKFCEELATAREATQEVRSNSRNNWVFYVRQAAALFPSVDTVQSEPPATEVVELKEPWLEPNCPAALDDQHSCTGGVAVNGGWLTLTQQILSKEEGPTHLHRFMQLDKEFRVQAVSEPFYFFALGQEQCSSLALLEEDQLHVTVSLPDGQKNSLVLEVEDVRRQLRVL